MSCKLEKKVSKARFCSFYQLSFPHEPKKWHTDILELLQLSLNTWSKQSQPQLQRQVVSRMLAMLCQELHPWLLLVTCWNFLAHLIPSCVKQAALLFGQSCKMSRTCINLLRPEVAWTAD
jgi:hypothetical protein